MEELSGVTLVFDTSRPGPRVPGLPGNTAKRALDTADSRVIPALIQRSVPGCCF